MPAILEFIVPRRPLSHQSGHPQHKQAWKEFVYGRAFAIWKSPPISSGDLKFTVVYLCEDHPIDINNVIKPIQDALTTLVYSDDNLVTDVSGHLRYLSSPIDIVNLPQPLADAVIGGVECVYVRISAARELNSEVPHD
jgi:crossover junction endodeoxyribonuclease RusA